MAQFNLNGIHKIYSAKGMEHIALNVFNNMGSLSHFNNQVQGGPAASMPISPVIRDNIIKCIEGAIAGGPGTRYSIGKSQWNDNEKKMIPVCSIVIGMDDSKLMYLAIKSPKMSEPFVGLFKVAKAVTLGGDPDESQRSILDARAFCNVLQNEFATALVISRDAADMAASAQRWKDKQNSGGGGGGNTGPSTDLPF